MVGREKQEKYTKLSKVILASSCEVRKEMLKQYFSKVINVPHKAEEEKYKKQKKKTGRNRPSNRKSKGFIRINRLSQ